MNRGTALVLFAVFSWQVVHAKTIETALFSIDVPSQWTIEDNKSDVILVMGDRVRDRTPMPFLSIQYCSKKHRSSHEIARCDRPCSEQSLDFSMEDDSENYQFSPVVKTTQQDGTVQFRTELIAPIMSTVGFMTLSCSSLGQVYLALVSDRPQSEAKGDFGSIVRSLKWKMIK